MLPPAAVLGEYADPVRRADWERVDSGFSGATVWKGSLDRVSQFALKCWPTSVSTERIPFIHRAQSDVSSLSFVPKLIRTRRGNTFCDVDRRLWDVSTWMPGDAESGNDFIVPRRRAAVNALVSIHRIWASTFQAEEICPAVQRRLSLIDDYRQWSHSRATGTNDSQLVTLMARLPVHLNKAELVLRPWTRQRVPVHLCFTDVHREHVLFTDDEVTGLIDFGAVKLDSPAADLARLFGENEKTLAEVIREYSGITLPPGLAETLAATAPACNLAAWTLRLLRDGDAVTNETAVRQRISNWVDRLH
jgi:thiamine kinase-like enzyme